jgi:hypothetical protein
MMLGRRGEQEKRLRPGVRASAFGANEPANSGKTPARHTSRACSMR